MNKYASLPIFFDSKILNVYREETQEKYGISDIKFKMKQKKDYLELTVDDTIICYHVQENGICNLCRIRKTQKKGC